MDNLGGYNSVLDMLYGFVNVANGSNNQPNIEQRVDNGMIPSDQSNVTQNPPPSYEKAVPILNSVKETVSAVTNSITSKVGEVVQGNTTQVVSSTKAKITAALRSAWGALKANPKFKVGVAIAAAVVIIGAVAAIKSLILIGALALMLLLAYRIFNAVREKCCNK